MLHDLFSSLKDIKQQYLVLISPDRVWDVKLQRFIFFWKHSWSKKNCCLSYHSSLV